MSATAISKDAVLRVFRMMPCVNLRQLAHQLGVDVANAVLAKTLATLEKAGQIRRLWGTGRRTVFVLASFEAC